MRILLLADVFPPLRSSGAVQLRDLSRELCAQGHEVVALVASPNQTDRWRIDKMRDVTVVRLHTPRTKDMSYLRRTIGEFLMPFAMLRNFRKSPLGATKFDAVVWYSPTIFLGPAVKSLKRQNKCPSYLIIRDIFPQWAADMGLMRRGAAYRVLDAVARYQYSAADIIGVQTPGNLSFFAKLPASSRIEVLQNWLSPALPGECSIDLSTTSLAGRKIFVYAGNMGIAQGMDTILDLVTQLRTNPNIGFVFVGRGSDAAALQVEARRRNLENVAFYDEIEPDEIPGLYAQCHVGLVSLDRRHKTHNIPGKFLSYMQAGLPVLASINSGNDLNDIIRTRGVGQVSTSGNSEDLADLALKMLVDDLSDPDISQRCKQLSEELFSPAVAAKQIVDALTATLPVSSLSKTRVH